MRSIAIAFLCLLHLDIFAQAFRYPATAIRPVRDTIFGRIVQDDYRWLEGMNNEDVRDWLKAQASLTDSVLAGIPGRNKLISEYKELDGIVKVSIPYPPRRGGDVYFYMKSFAGLDIPKLYYRKGKSGKEMLLYDPYVHSNGIYRDASYRFFPSRDGKKVALTLSRKGNSDISTLRILDVASGNFLADSLFPVGSFQAWTLDNKGFLYGLLQTGDPSSTSLFQDIEVRTHMLGEKQSEDKLVISRKNDNKLNLKSSDFLFVNYSPDNKYLLLLVWTGAQDRNPSFFAPASQLGSRIDWRVLAKPEDEVRQALIYREKAYWLTRKNAPNFKILVSPPGQFDYSAAKTLVPESVLPIQVFNMTKDYLFPVKSDGINTYFDQINLINGKLDSVRLPDNGTVWLETFDGTTNDCEFVISSWRSPSKCFAYDPDRQKFTVSTFYIPLNFTGVEDLVVEEVEVKSHDGVMVPLSLVYHKNLKKNGQNIAFMTGYGSYGSTNSSFFDPMYLPLLNRGVVLAITHPRGGGEKGYAWHMGGFKATKPNTWKDFIACGEYLIQNRYTSSDLLIGDGTSAGGILIGRAMTERPELFAVAINNVPVSNPLRGENRPNGLLDANEFGTAKDSTEAMGLMEMDTYLHVNDHQKYPAVLAVTAINDTRVPFWQPGKLVAALQRSKTERPVLLLVNYDSGHGAEEKQVLFRDYANRFAFALWQTGHKDFQPQKTKVP